MGQGPGPRGGMAHGLSGLGADLGDLARGWDLQGAEAGVRRAALPGRVSGGGPGGHKALEHGSSFRTASSAASPTA